MGSPRFCFRFSACVGHDQRSIYIAVSTALIAISRRDHLYRGRNLTGTRIASFRNGSASSVGSTMTLMRAGLQESKPFFTASDSSEGRSTFSPSATMSRPICEVRIFKVSAYGSVVAVVYLVLLLSTPLVIAKDHDQDGDLLLNCSLCLQNIDNSQRVDLLF
jgi:hypothetical protein